MRVKRRGEIVPEPVHVARGPRWVCRASGGMRRRSLIWLLMAVTSSHCLAGSRACNIIVQMGLPVQLLSVLRWTNVVVTDPRAPCNEATCNAHKGQRALGILSLHDTGSRGRCPIKRLAIDCVNREPICGLSLKARNECVTCIIYLHAQGSSRVSGLFIIT